MMVSVLTPTCNRPAGLALAERWMRRQTRPPDQWVVVDGGTTPAAVTAGQTVLRRPAPPGPRNFAENLAAGIPEVSGDVIVLWEDDDYYAPTHLERIVGQLDAAPNARIAGDDQQRYYSVRHRRYKVMQNRGASLCQTAFRRELLPVFARIIAEQLRAQAYGVDAHLWQAVPKDAWSLVRTETVVGIKGLPGQTGLGIGHRPQVANWAPDPKGQKLRAWIGADADVYLQVTYGGH